MTERRPVELAWLPAGAHHLVLRGYSGAGIALVENARGDRFIRKIAGRPGDNDRLRAQADRQIAYGRRVDFVRVPEVLGCGEFEGRFFFDMQVVDGFDAASHLRTASFDAVAAISDTLCELIRYSGEQAPLTDSVPLRQALSAKLDDLRLRLAGAEPETQTVLESLDQLVAVAPDGPRAHAVPRGSHARERSGRPPRPGVAARSHPASLRARVVRRRQVAPGSRRRLVLALGPRR